jgi:hypothetical protein
VSQRMSRGMGGIFITTVVGLALAACGPAVADRDGEGEPRETGSTGAALAGPFEYPVDGQVIDYEGDYLLKAALISGATGYLVGMFQNGVLQYENYRDSGSLSRDVAVLRGSTHRTRLLPNIPTVVTVRGLVNGQWTAMQQITITLRPRSETVKVLELKYFPLDASGNLDAAETGITATLAQIRTTVNGLSSGTEQSLEQGSTYVKQQGIGAYLSYQKVATYELLEKVPRSAQFPPFGDHFAMLNRFNICNYVDVQGVRDVWVWMYHTNSVAPIESNMSMGTTSAAWYNHGTYGDISNSYQQNDLPRCVNTYVVYNFNYGRGVAEAIHDYGHQQERLLSYADSTMFGQFVNPFGPGTGTRACGNVHNPPNSTADYDYANATAVTSRCSDWRPDGTGAAESVSCAKWGCTGDPQRGFLVWWFQRIPGRGNALAKNGVRLRNWNELIWDFDKAMRFGRRLTE